MNARGPRFRRPGLFALLSAAAASAAGCGDGPICQQEILVVIQSPTGAVTADVDGGRDGLQADVLVRSTLGADAEMQLQVLDAAGEVLGEATATTGPTGDATFEAVDLPDGAASLRAYASAGECGEDEDVVAIEAAPGGDCVLAFRQAPLDNEFYAPLKVLNASLDQDADADDFQGDLDVTTAPGASVELFVVDAATGAETSAGTADADDAGDASFAVTLGQGVKSVRAVCTSGPQVAPSSTTTVLVDTEVECAITAPAAGTTLTPGLDANADLADGLQLTVAGAATGGDVEGEPASFEVTVDGDTVAVAAPALDADGATSADATFAPAMAPATVALAFATQDHAGNACEVTRQYGVVYDGCDITVVAPTTTQTVDADGDDTNGVQVEVELAIDPACAGRPVTSDCGLDDPTGTVAVDGTATLTVDWCAGASCDVTAECTFSVSSPDDIQTSTGATLDFDNLPPGVAVLVTNPSGSCNRQVTPSIDIDDATAGIQVGMRVVSPTALTLDLDQASDLGATDYDPVVPGGDVTVTLVSGLNAFVATATDDVGNVGTSTACDLTLADIAVDVNPPADDGTVTGADGTVAGTSLTFDLCGDVSTAGAVVTVSVDGGAPITATTTGTGWCATLTLAESATAYALDIVATAGTATGSTTLDLAVDVTPPDAIADLALTADTRQSIEATWTAPAGAAAYVVRVSDVALTPANFATTGELVTANAPGAAGDPETLRVSPRRTGTPAWLGIAAVDAGGNASAPAIVGPVTPAFDATGAFVDVADGLKGATVTSGLFNDDEFYDVALSSAGIDSGGRVSVYFGGPSGIDGTADVVIDAGAPGISFGLSMAAVRWSSSTRHDLVVGAPFDDNSSGRVYVFRGGATFGAGIATAADASTIIGVDAGSAVALSAGFLGWSMASLDFDGNTVDDLVIGAPGADGGNGAAVIVYGGTVSGASVLLSDTSAATMGTTVAQLVIDARNDVAYDIFPNFAINVGETLGGADVTDDVLLSYADGAQVVVLRGSTTRPTTPGMTVRAASAQDLLVTYAGADVGTSEFGDTAGSLYDLNSDGARELVIGAWGDNGATGSVFVMDGNATGTTTTDSALATIAGTAQYGRFGGAIVNNSTRPGADVDGDGIEDLMVVARETPFAKMLLWFGGEVPTGATTADSASLVIDAPLEFDGGTILNPGAGYTNYTAGWVGDVNGDGLADICWSDQLGEANAGAFEVLWDDGV
jgi:hypothetical protein